MGRDARAGGTTRSHFASISKNPFSSRNGSRLLKKSFADWTEPIGRVPILVASSCDEAVLRYSKSKNGAGVLAMSTAGPNDGSLLARLRDHDPDAFAELDMEYRPRLIRLVRRQGLYRAIRRRIDAEDIVQDALLSFATHLPLGLLDRGDTDQFSTILTTIALNSLRKEYRRQFAGRRSVSREATGRPTRDGDDGWEPIDPHASPSELVAADDQESLLTRGLPRLHQAIVIRRLRGYSVTELARITGISRSTIRRIWDDAVERYRAWQQQQDVLV